MTTTVPPFRAFERAFEIDGRPAAQRDEDRLRSPGGHDQPAILRRARRGPFVEAAASRTRTARPVRRPSSSTSGSSRSSFPVRTRSAAESGSSSAMPTPEQPAPPSGGRSSAISPSIRHAETTAGRKRSGRSISRTGRKPAGRRVADRSQPAAAGVAGRLAAPGGAGRRRRSAGLHDPDTRSDDGRGALAVPLFGVTFGVFGRDRAGAVFGRTVCGDGLLRSRSGHRKSACAWRSARRRARCAGWCCELGLVQLGHRPDARPRRRVSA